jgi:hypothetical protein
MPPYRTILSNEEPQFSINLVSFTGRWSLVTDHWSLVTVNLFPDCLN